MGLFSRKKKDKAPQQEEVSVNINTNLKEGFKRVGVDGIFLIEVPQEWQAYESDRFRMKSPDEQVHLSITNYGMEGTAAADINELKQSFLPLFEKFVKEGGYEPHDDLDTSGNYVYRAFKVDEETQYYYYTSRLIQNKQKVIAAFIIREMGPYKESTRDLIKHIGANIATKVK